VRLLDLGAVSYLESQTIYHAVAHAMDNATPNTIALVSPDRPYVCIGYHQDLNKEIDLEYCRSRDLPVLRREVGGGATYLDGDQLFVQFIFHRENLPRKVEEMYKVLIGPLVETYRTLGIEAHHRPLNDILVGDRKIGGTGIAAIGQAIVIVGSLMFDFDSDAVAHALRVSSEKMRDKIYQGVRDYMTTMKRELGRQPPRQRVKSILIEKLRDALEVELEPGGLSHKERKTVEAVNRRFLSPRWLRRKGGLPQRGILIRGGVRVVEAEHKAPGGLIRVTARLREDEIEDLTLSGDFTFHPQHLVEELEVALRNRRLDEHDLTGAIDAFYRAHRVQSPGVSPKDLAATVLRLRDDPSS
jgi:lipoate-protein ligase A